MTIIWPPHKTAAWLIEQLKRDDLTAETRKRFSNRLKMQKPRHPQAPDVNKRHPHYNKAAWRKIAKRRKAAQASRRRNRS